MNNSNEFTIVGKRHMDDATAAAAVKITWLIEQSNSVAQQRRKIHTERLCREAIEGGFVRAALGRNPSKMCIR